MEHTHHEEKEEKKPKGNREIIIMVVFGAIASRGISLIVTYTHKYLHKNVISDNLIIGISFLIISVISLLIVNNFSLQGIL